MNIIHSKTFDSNLKKIKKHKIEYNNLLKILNIIENTDNFKELTLLPQIKMYGFERLKYQYNDYYSFNLRKTGGKIRLIVKPNDENEIELFLIDISYNHYQDFDIKKVVYYE